MKWPSPTPILCSLLLLSLFPSVVAAPTAVDSGEVEQGVFGGTTILVSNQTAGEASSSLAELPDIAEIYTATWCENCVDAEGGLGGAAINNDEPTVQLAYHREFNENEDPFGTVEGDQRWEARYGPISAATVGLKRAPPTIIVNGELMHAGSGNAEASALEPLYSASLSSDTEFGNAAGTSSLSWASEDGVTGVVNWSLELDDKQGRLVESILFVVEDSAIFEQGSNGIGDYRHVIRAVHTLTGDSGEFSLTLPDTWDGEDLSLVLLHQWYEPAKEGKPAEEEPKGIPAAGAASLAVMSMAAASLLGRSKARRP